MHTKKGMNNPFSKKRNARFSPAQIAPKHVAAGVGAAAGIGLLAFGVKKLIDRNKQSRMHSDIHELKSPAPESVRGFMDRQRPNNRVDRDSIQSFPASDAPSHMPGVS